MRLRHLPPVESPVVLRDVLAGAFGRSGPGALEETLRERHRVAAVTLTDSGTSALTLALRLAAARRPGTACVLPGFACYDLATAAVGAEVPVRLYDVDPETLGPRWDSLEAALSQPTSAVVVVHLFGIPVDVERVQRLAAASGALVIDDAAQAAGAELHGRPLGGFGDLGVLSFGRGKGVTGAGGGALLHRDARHPTERVESLAAAASGRVRVVVPLLAQWALARPLLYGIPARIPALALGQTKYRTPHLPTEMPTASTRVVLRTLRHADRDGRRRRATAHRYATVLEWLAVATPTSDAPAARPGYLRFPVMVPEGRQASDCADATLGIVPSYPMPLRTLGPLGPRLQDSPSTPGAEALARRLVTLPTHARLSARDLHDIERWIRRTLG